MRNTGETLADRQAEMRSRQPETRAGRPRLEAVARARERLKAFVMLQHGFTPDQVALALGKNPDSVRRWIEAGYSLR